MWMLLYLQIFFLYERQIFADEFTDGKPETPGGSDIISVPGRPTPTPSPPDPISRPSPINTDPTGRSLSVSYLTRTSRTVTTEGGSYWDIIELSSSESNIWVSTPGGRMGIAAVKGLLEYDYANAGSACYKDGYCTRPDSSDSETVGKAICESQGLRYETYSGSRVLVADHRGLSGYQIELNMGTRDYSGSQFMVRVKNEGGRLVTNGSRRITSDYAYVSVSSGDARTVNGDDIWVPIRKIFCVP